MMMVVEKKQQVVFWFVLIKMHERNGFSYVCMYEIFRLNFQGIMILPNVFSLIRRKIQVVSTNFLPAIKGQDSVFSFRLMNVAQNSTIQGVSCHQGKMTMEPPAPL